MENFKKETEQENLKKESQEDIADTYEDGRAWEDIPTEELVIIRSDNFLDWEICEKVEAILEERKAKRLADIKALDDGSVKGLIVSSNKYMNLGCYVLMQRTLNGIRELNDGFRACTTQVCCDEEDGGFLPPDNWTVGCRWEDFEERADSAVTLCRRKFKKEEMILCVFPDYKKESGIVFLEDRICTFREKNLEYIISYAEMEEVDFTEDSVTIRVSGGEEASIYCGDKEEYAKGVFNLLMDIKDRLGYR